VFQLFFIGVALVFVFEGFLPFLSPRLWRQMMAKMILQSNQSLRLCGLVSMLVGVGLLYIVH
jgi:uncharacterized protein